MAANATNEVDNAMKKLLTNPGVTQYLICNADGIAIKYHNMDWKTAVQYCALVNDLVQKSKAAVEALLDPSENTVEYIRLHTAKNKEIIIAPAREYTLIAVQEPVKIGAAAFLICFLLFSLFSVLSSSSSPTHTKRKLRFFFITPFSRHHLQHQP
jgi:predicted regulator of Ras-like GTPase activity (Roadblock/LC7/MglB family)